MYPCVQVCMFVCVHAFIYIYIYIYTYSINIYMCAKVYVWNHHSSSLARRRGEFSGENVREEEEESGEGGSGGMNGGGMSRCD